MSPPSDVAADVAAGAEANVGGMRIGELASRTGASRRSLRHYEAQGLLDAGRTTAGYRSYGEEAVVRVANVRRLLADGLTVEDVRAFLPCLGRDLTTEPVCDTATQVYRDRLDADRRRRDDLDRVYACLAHRLGEREDGAGRAT